MRFTVISIETSIEKDEENITHRPLNQNERYSTPWDHLMDMGTGYLSIGARQIGIFAHRIELWETVLNSYIRRGQVTEAGNPAKGQTNNYDSIRNSEVEKLTPSILINVNPVMKRATFINTEYESGLIKTVEGR